MTKEKEIVNILKESSVDIFIKESLAPEINLDRLCEDIEELEKLAEAVKISDDLYIKLNYSFHLYGGKFELFSIGSGNTETVIKRWHYYNIGKLFYKYNVPKVYNYVTRNGNVLWDQI